MANKPQISYQEIIREEYKKCMESPVYFMRHYIKIQHPIRGKILFDLFSFQEKTLQDFVDHKFSIILKSRQMGISTLVAAFSLWTMIFNKDKSILIISTKQEVAKELVSKVRFANDNLPTWLKIKCEEDNKLSLKFINGSNIRATTSSGDAGRSMANSLLVIDEAAFIPEIEEIWTSAWNTLSTGGNAIVLSTPKGVGNWFHQMWIKSERAENNFHNISLPWHLHPERTKDWRDIQSKELGPKQASQECDCEFLSSGDNVVDLPIIDFYRKTYMKDPQDIRGADKGLWVWEYPADNHTYLVIADVARGDGGDFSAAHVLDITSPLVTQAAEYKGSYGTKDFGNFLFGLASEYNSALLVVERESIGWATLTTIIERGYKNLFYSSADLKYVDVQHQLNNKIDSEEKKLVPGFSTNMKTRPLLVSNLELYFREKGVIIYSKRTLGELETFIWKNGKAQAMSEKYNDDLVISLGIGLWIRDTALRLRLQGIELTRATLDQFNKTKTDQSPVYKQNQAQLGKNAWKMNAGRSGFGKQNIEDISWLIN